MKRFETGSLLAATIFAIAALTKCMPPGRVPPVDPTAPSTITVYLRLSGACGTELVGFTLTLRSAARPDGRGNSGPINRGPSPYPACDDAGAPNNITESFSNVRAGDWNVSYGSSLGFSGSCDVTAPAGSSASVGFDENAPGYCQRGH